MKHFWGVIQLLMLVASAAWVALWLINDRGFM